MKNPQPLKGSFIFLIMIFLLSGCVSNKRILREVVLLKSAVVRLDSVYSSTQINLFQYEKNRIDSTRYDAMPDEELLQRARAANRR